MLHKERQRSLHVWCSVAKEMRVANQWRFFLSSLSFKRKQERECCVVYDDDRQRVEEPPMLWYQMLGTRSSVRKYKHDMWWWRTCVCEWAIYRERERERWRDRHKENVIFVNSNSYNSNNQPPSLKVTRSLYIVTILGQLPFMLFIEIAQTWVVQRDSVNMAIIHSYSTLPHNGRIHGLYQITGIYKVIRHIDFVRVGMIRRQKTEPAGSEELKPILKEPMSVVRNPPVLCAWLLQDQFFITPI